MREEYTLKELAEAIGRTKNSIAYQVQQMPEELRAESIFTDDNGVRHITEPGFTWVIRQMRLDPDILNKKRGPGRSRKKREPKETQASSDKSQEEEKDNGLALTYQSILSTISVLQQQLNAKDEQLSAKDGQIEALQAQNSRLIALIEQESEKNQMQEIQEAPKKSFWKRVFG